MNQFETAKKIMVVMASLSVKGLAYNWSADIIKREIESAVSSIKKSEPFAEIDINKLSKDQLIELGFGNWDGSGFLLIPVWILPFMKEDFYGCCIDGERGFFNKNKIDKDSRFGCLAYGVFPSESGEPQ